MVRDRAGCCKRHFAARGRDSAARTAGLLEVLRVFLVGSAARATGPRCANHRKRSCNNLLALLACFSLAGCGDDPLETPDVGFPDGAAREDGGRNDGGGVRRDAGPMRSDAGPPEDASTMPGDDAGGAGDAGDSVCPEHDLGPAFGLAVASGSTVGSDDDVEPSCLELTGPDETFGWTAPASGRFAFDTFGSDYDTLLSLRSAGCGGAELDCADDIGAAIQSRVDATVVEGDRLVIAIDGYGGETGAFVLNITQPPEMETVCDDRIDEDRDGETDCIDEECLILPMCVETMCSDGIDNEGDGRADCRDFDCRSDPACA
jgi:hypothetical protein